TCSVTATRAADTNYNSTTSVAATVSATLANQATLTVTGVPGTAQPYNANFTVGFAGGSGTGALTFAASGACSNTAGGALITMTSGTGTCSVTATRAADTNYNSTTSVAATVTAQPAIAIVNSLPTASAIIYGQMLSSSTLTGGSAAPSDGSFEWTTPTAIPLAGTQSESVIFVPADTVDYSSSAPATVNVTVNPASYIVTVSSDDSGTASNCTPQTTPGHGTDASCSLRDALLEAAATGGGNITFDATAFATTKTITLTNGPLIVPSATSIAGATTGSGASQVNLVTVDGNNASAVFSVSPSVTGASIANLTIQHGNGGILNFGALTLTGDSITSNTTSGGSGGAIYNSGTLTLTESTISGNTSANMGGGINNAGTLTLSDDTMAGNSASTMGGGIYNTATLVVSDSTLSANTATSRGGGIYNGSGTVALANSVLSGNTSNSASDDFDGTAFIDNGGNIAGVVNGSTVNGTAINLAPLASYGGPTQTLIPLPGSPAICAGLASAIPSGLFKDQRGLPNTNATYPNYAACVDAGAVETNYALSFSTEPSNSQANTNFTAGVTLTESGNPFAPSVTIPL
ncbi:MAG: choice-of-anchor Q domain-containing protein, partial [Terracidiphilus sp.]|nr:choice-of-anchor Q domain-containing protein [Terracidiphilus sp.]